MWCYTGAAFLTGILYCMKKLSAILLLLIMGLSCVCWGDDEGSGGFSGFKLVTTQKKYAQREWQVPPQFFSSGGSKAKIRDFFQENRIKLSLDGQVSYVRGESKLMMADTAKNLEKVDRLIRKYASSVEIENELVPSVSCAEIEDGKKTIIPYPDTYYKIFKPGTQEECEVGDLGEICLRGPSVMVGYLDKPEENASTLQTHPDGHVWLHTGDLGYIDAEGFIYFKQRLKRMIITSGYNVYPSQIENIIDGHEAVQMSCVIGVKDEIKMQKIKAFVVLNNGYEESDELKQNIMDYLKQHVAKYAMPYAIEVRKELPKTLVGKVAYTVLEKEEAEKGNA